jgi:transposase
MEQHAPNCRIVYDKFHIMQHANHAIDEVRRAEFFRKGQRMRGLVKGKRWLLLTRWLNLSVGKRQDLNQLFALTGNCSKPTSSRKAWIGSGTIAMKARC